MPGGWSILLNNCFDRDRQRLEYCSNSFRVTAKLRRWSLSNGQHGRCSCCEPRPGPDPTGADLPGGESRELLLMPVPTTLARLKDGPADLRTPRAHLGGILGSHQIVLPQGPPTASS
jgi:hypothetical protein